MITRLLADARQKLVETGSRNRLVNTVRDKPLSRAINIVNERSKDIFDILYRSQKAMSFKALGCNAEVSPETDSPELEIIEARGQIDESRFTDSFLETKLTADALQKKLIAVARDANTAEQEQGVNILYLAMGFLAWRESESSSILRHAPLILLPVQLVRNSATATYDVLCREDQLVTNMSLQERLKSDFGITLPEVVEDENWTTEGYFEQVKNCIQSKPSWTIDQNGMQLGFFSFAKLLMLRDLDPVNWPGQSLQLNPLVNGLLGKGFPDEAPLFDTATRLDDVLEPVDIVQVVDADISQTKVIEEVRAGKSIVVQGPPGTGKSQTITNIIASAVGDGKTVLFMAEKMAALDVVHQKLQKVELQNVCLELHSKSANSKAVLESLGKTLKANPGQISSTKTSGRLKDIRDGLNFCAETVNRKLLPSEETPYSVMGKQSLLLSQGVNTLTNRIPHLASLTPEQILHAEKDVVSLAEEVGKCADFSKHPLHGVGNGSLQPTDLRRLQEETASCAVKLKKLSSDFDSISKLLNLELNSTFSNCDVLARLAEVLSEPTRLPITKSGESFLRTCLNAEIPVRLTDLLAKGQGLADQKSSLSEFFMESAWNFDVTEVRLELMEGMKSRFIRLRQKYRQATKALQSILKIKVPTCPAERVFVADQLLNYQHEAKAFFEEDDYLRQQLGVYWCGRDTKYSEIEDLVGWCKRVASIAPSINVATAIALSNNSQHTIQLSSTFRTHAECMRNDSASIMDRLGMACLKEELYNIPLDHVAVRFEKFSEVDEQQYSSWTAIQRARASLDSLDLQELRARIETGQLDADQAKNALKLAHVEAIWDSGAKENVEALRTLNRQQMVAEFKQLEQLRNVETRGDISEKHLSRIPSAPTDQIGLIRGEIGKKRNRKCVRELMDGAPNAIQILKPVFLMSPISIAQFLPPGKIQFDVLVIDEASQVRPEDAFGAIARCKQIVVVGDQKQMPPSNFFGKATSNENHDDSGVDEMLGGTARATEMESVLSLCEARNLGGKPRMLEWHYRSQDPSLIAVSNDEFYDGNLILPPSPLQDDDEFGMKLTRVQGIYKSGEKRINVIEANEIVDRLSEHARRTPKLSVGVVALSMAQQCHIHEVLEHRRRVDEVLDDFMRAKESESVFVKNLENVQGDERDVILISICYGPQEAGGNLKSMRFGPVNSEGGERRLNVLFSRARLRCEIFCSFDPGEIDLRRNDKEGVRILKRYLDFAESGILNDNEVTGLGPDSPFEEDVAKEMRKLGYQVEYQVGSAGFRIDLAVRNPNKLGRFMLAVECDGATYHSALWARERDRLRQGVLENLGWRFHRIWSTDWFYNRATEVDRLKSALESAVAFEDQGKEEIVVSGDDARKRDVEPPVLDSAASNEASNCEPDYLSLKQDISLKPTEVPLQSSIALAPTPNEFVESTTPNEDLDLTVYAEVNTLLSMSEKPASPDLLPAELKSEKLNSSLCRLANYEEFVSATVSDKEPHECDIQYLADLVGRIVETEGPIHFDLIAKRVAKSFRKSRAGTQIQSATRNALVERVKSDSPHPLVLNVDDFWFTSCQQNRPRVRDRSAASDDARKSKWIPPMEIDAAVCLALDGSRNFEQEKLPNEVARILGFKRLGDKLKVKILEAISGPSQQPVASLATASTFQPLSNV